MKLIVGKPLVDNLLAAGFKNILNTSWRRLEIMLPRIVYLENVLKTSLQDVFYIPWRCLQDSWWSLEDDWKTSWRRLKDVWPRRIYWSWSKHLEGVLKTSSEDVWVRRIYLSWSRRLEDVFWRRRRITSSRRLQDVFIKTNVCWDALTKAFTEF